MELNEDGASKDPLTLMATAGLRVLSQLEIHIRIIQVRNRTLKIRNARGKLSSWERRKRKVIRQTPVTEVGALLRLPPHDNLHHRPSIR